MRPRKCKNLFAETGGNVGLLGAILAPVLMIGAMGGIDVMSMLQAKRNLQDIADATALAGAKEMTLANASPSTLVTTTHAHIDTQMLAHFSGVDYTSNVAVDDKESTVSVTINLDLPNKVVGIVFPEYTKIAAKADAAAKGGTKVCAVALNPNNSEALSLTDQAGLTANGCSLYSNSSKPDAISLGMNTAISADLLCSSGGISNSSKNFSGEEVTDCPALEDPLAGKAAPLVSAVCDYTDMSLSKQKKNDPVVTLSPGVYCGGLHLDMKAKVNLQPGNYIIKGGKFIVEKMAEVIGDDVTFYFTGTGTGLWFEKDSDIEIAAPKSGPQAGILFMEDRNLAPGHEYRISSASARELLGTIYLPNGTFYVDSQQPVSAESDYTIILANEIKLSSRPNLHLNSNYASSPVPVPEGVGLIGGQVYIRR